MAAYVMCQEKIQENADVNVSVMHNKLLLISLLHMC